MLTVAEMAAVGQKQFEVVPEFAPAVFSAVVGEQMLDPGGVVFIERQHPVVEHISSATTRVRLGAEDMKLKKDATVKVVIKSTEIMLEK